MVQINVPPIPSFSIPNTTGTVVGVGNVEHARPVKEEGDLGGEPGGGGQGPEQQDTNKGPLPNTERRDIERRSGQDRRKQQIPVLLDTRVGERRKTQRREEDPLPPAVDFRV